MVSVYKRYVGIDLEQYRVRIGGARNIKAEPIKGKCPNGETLLSLNSYLLALYSSILVYLLPLLFGLHISNPYSLKLKPKMVECFIETNNSNYIDNIHFLCVFLFISNYSRVGVFHKIPSLLRINLAHSLVIISLPINVFNQSIILCCFYAYSFRIYCDIILYKINAIIIKAFSTTYLIASLLLFLIILANVSILNPGPEKIDTLNCYFQNAQGFVTLNSISKPFPDLCITKILEFQT